MSRFENAKIGKQLTAFWKFTALASWPTKAVAATTTLQSASRRGSQHVTTVPCPTVACNRNRPAVGFDDLVAERQAEAGAGGFGGVERDQGLAQDFVGHAGAAVADADDDSVVAALHGHDDLRRRAS